MLRCRELGWGLNAVVVQETIPEISDEARAQIQAQHQGHLR